MGVNKEFREMTADFAVQVDLYGYARTQVEATRRVATPATTPADKLADDIHEAWVRHANRLNERVQQTLKEINEYE